MVGSPENPTPWDPEERIEDKWDESDHGKASTYNAGCRCEKCVAANTEKAREFRHSKSGEKTRRRETAKRRAWKRLQAMHPDEFAELVNEELDALAEDMGR